MTDYSVLHRVMRWEPGLFDATAPTSVHRLRQLFEHSNHLLDSQLQTRVSVAFPAAGWSWPFGPFEGEYRLIQTHVVPWRVLTYGAYAPALARPIVFAAGMMNDVNEYVQSVEFSVSMQSAQAPNARLRASAVIKRWGSTPITATTVTTVIDAYDDISESKLVSESPESCERAIASRDVDDNGDLYDSRLKMTMVKFHVWIKPVFDGGEDWVIPPGYLSHLYIREGAR